MYRSIAHALLAAFVAVLAMTFTTSDAAMAASTSESCLPSSLRQRLSQVRSQFGPINVVSTHRPGARIAGTGRVSLHASCQAVDFVPPAGRYSAVAAWLRSNHGGGVGTYSSGHIHIDSGAMVRFHRGGGTQYASRSRAGRFVAGGKRSRPSARETLGGFAAPTSGI